LRYLTSPLYLPERDFRLLFDWFGPSLGLWRAAEVAALREAGQRGEPYAEPVLDLGCGDGLVSSLVFSKIAVALDPDHSARNRAFGLGIYERAVPFLMEDARLATNSFGTVVSNSALEHSVRIDAALESAARVLKPGGRLVFTCPTEAFSHWLALPFDRYAARRNRHFQQLNLWEVDEWRHRLNQAGLEMECVRPYLKRGWVWIWDLLELMQMVSFRKVRAFGWAWRRLPPTWLDFFARRASRIDLSAPAPGGGRLVIARKVE
jgi:SAM-dependent methyltransferase